MKFGVVVYKTIAINLWIDVPSTSVDDSVKDLGNVQEKGDVIATSIPHFLGFSKPLAGGFLYWL